MATRPGGNRNRAKGQGTDRFFTECAFRLGIASEYWLLSRPDLGARSSWMIFSAQRRKRHPRCRLLQRSLLRSAQVRGCRLCENIPSRMVCELCCDATNCRCSPATYSKSENRSQWPDPALDGKDFAVHGGGFPVRVRGAGVVASIAIFRPAVASRSRYDRHDPG